MTNRQYSLVLLPLLVCVSPAIADEATAPPLTIDEVAQVLDLRSLPRPRESTIVRRATVSSSTYRIPGDRLSAVDVVRDQLQGLGWVYMHPTHTVQDASQAVFRKGAFRVVLSVKETVYSGYVKVSLRNIGNVDCVGLKVPNDFRLTSQAPDKAIFTSSDSGADIQGAISDTRRCELAVRVKLSDSLKLDGWVPVGRDRYKRGVLCLIANVACQKVGTTNVELTTVVMPADLPFPLELAGVSLNDEADTVDFHGNWSLAEIAQFYKGALRAGAWTLSAESVDESHERMTLTFQNAQEEHITVRCRPLKGATVVTIAFTPAG